MHHAIHTHARATFAQVPDDDILFIRVTLIDASSLGGDILGRFATTRPFRSPNRPFNP
jgi:hypothetical protein